MTGNRRLFKLAIYQMARASIAWRIPALALSCALLLSVGLAGCEEASAKDACPHLEQLSARHPAYSQETINDIVDSTKGPFDDDGLTVDVDHAHATAQALNAAVKVNSTQATALAEQLDNQMMTIAQDCSRIVGGG